MKKLLFIILLLSTYSFGQRELVRMNVLTDTTQALRAQIAGYGYQTASQVRTIVSDTATTLRASIAAKLDADFSTYDAYTTPTDADILIVQKEGSTDLAKVELANMPVSITVTDAINIAVEGAGSNADITALENELSSLQAEFYAYKLATDARLDALEGEITIPDPTAPTNLVGTADPSLMQIVLTWTETTSLCDSVYIYGKATTLDIVAPIIARVDSGVGTYTHTGLNEATTYIYQAKTVKYINGVAVLSNFSNTATATTTVTDPPVFADNSDLNEDWEQGNLDSAYAIVDGESTDGTVGLEIVDAIFGNYSMYSRVDSSLGQAYAWYKLPTPLADGDTIWIRFDFESDYLTGTGETSNYKEIFALGDSVGGAFQEALRMSFRKQNNDDGLFAVRMNNNNNTLSGATVTLDSVIELNQTTRVLIALQTSYDSVDNFVKVWVGDYNTGDMTQTYASNPFTTRELTTYIESEYLQLGVRTPSVTTTTIGDKFSFDNLVVASDSAGLFAEVDTTGGGTGNPDSTGAYESVLFVSAGATGTGDGTQLSPYTISQAKNIVVAGDTIIIEPGTYDFTTTSINFSANGTSALPIVWIGQNKNWDDEDCTSDSSTMFYGNSTTNVRITMSGNYNEFHNIVFKQGQPRQLIAYSGDNLRFDSCSFKYPSNIQTGSNHLVRASGDADNTTFYGCHIYHSPRTGIWHGYHSSTTNAPDSLTIEECTFIGHGTPDGGGHPAFQIMPATDAVNPKTIKGVVIKNNTFIDNPYPDLFYMRHCTDFKIYNNLAVRSGRWSFPMHPVAPYDTTGGGLIAYNTIYSTDTDFSWIRNNEATQRLIVKNNIVYSVPAFSSGILIRHTCWSGGSPPYGPIVGHDYDYNMYYNAAYGSTFGTTARVYWVNAGCDITNYRYNDWKTATGFDSHSTITTAPSFTDAGSDDYTLSSNTTGTPISGITTDKNGVTRNVTTPSKGCFEYVP